MFGSSHFRENDANLRVDASLSFNVYLLFMFTERNFLFVAKISMESGELLSVIWLFKASTTLVPPAILLYMVATHH